MGRLGCRRGGLFSVDTHHGNAFGLDGYHASTYGDSFADVYDDWYTDLDDSDFVGFVASVLPGGAASILELGVGTGRLLARLRELRRASDRLVGIDSSDKMLDIARRRFAGADDVVLHTGDFSTTVPDGPHDMVFIGYNTLFNLPDESSVASCFRAVAGQLARDGSMCIDAVAPVATQGGDDVSVRTMTTGEVVLSISRHDVEGQRITGQFVQFTHEGKTSLRPWVVRYFTPPQLDEIADRSGLRLIERFADGNRTTHTADSPRHISRYGPK